MVFFNFKENIISSRFSDGNITKDNLCNLFNIENVQDIHTSANDCILEWKLFEKIYDKKLFITNDKVFELNNDYIIPASYLDTHPKLKLYMDTLPEILFDRDIIKKFKIKIKNLKKFPSNFNGLIFEHLINILLNVKVNDSREFLLENKSKLKYIGKLPSTYDIVPMFFNSDGSVTAERQQDKCIEDEMNIFIENAKKRLKPLIEFIEKDIFHGRQINSQELVIHAQKNILALCDLSTQNEVLEIKTNLLNLSNVKNQLYYESNGRDCYILQVDWNLGDETLEFFISKITFYTMISKKVLKEKARMENFQKKIKNDSLVVLKYLNSHSKVKMKCKKCNHEWEISYTTIIKKPICPYCTHQEAKSLNHEKNIDKGQKRYSKEDKYYNKIKEKIGDLLKVSNYTGSKKYVDVECVVCGHKWSIRADHLIDRPYCPVCKKNRNL